jgi:hypothetical protein
MLMRLLMIAILVACGGGVQSQSLGEVAAKEKERRANTGGSAKSFTDADLRDAASKRAREGNPSPGNDVPPSVAPTRSDSSAMPPAAPDSSGPTDSSASEAAKKAEENPKAAERDWNYVSSHPWERAFQYEGARSRFETAKKRVELLRRQRDDIEDAARRERIPRVTT